MTITALITGKLIADPDRRTSATSGKSFTTARISAGTDDESVLCSVIAFGSVGEQLAAHALRGQPGPALPAPWRCADRGAWGQLRGRGVESLGGWLG